MVLFLVSAFSILLMAQGDVLSKYSFIPGEKTLYFEDYSDTVLGEIPSSAEMNGDAEVVEISGEKWLKAGDGTQMTLNLPETGEDLTLEFEIKARQVDSSYQFSLRFINEEKEYESWIDVAGYYVSWGGNFGEKSLPGNSTEKRFYASDETARVSVSFQKKSAKVYINRILAMNVTGFSPVMPRMIRFTASVPSEDGAFAAVKNIRIASEIPSIAREIQEKGKYISHGIYFKTASAEVLDESYFVIRQIAEVMKNQPQLKIKIVGHTDNSGKDPKKKQALSQLRAEEVKKYLLEKFSLSADRIQTDGKGDLEPLTDNTTPEKRAQNRRVEFIRI